MAPGVDPRELTAGYTFINRNLGTARAVLRDGDRVVWTCVHLPHGVASQARHCADAELERRRQGAKEVLWLGHCAPCWAFWDLGLIAGESLEDREPGENSTAGALLRGQCPQCGVPFTKARVAILERIVR